MTLGAVKAPTVEQFRDVAAELGMSFTEQDLATHLAALGPARIGRASHVEPDSQGRWIADLSPVGGPTLGPFDRRSETLETEVYWLEENWLTP